MDVYLCYSWYPIDCSSSYSGDNVKKWAIVGIIIIFVCSLSVVYNVGYNAGENSSNLDEVYARYLDSILPKENSFTYIVLENGSYFVGHNITQYGWEQLQETYDWVFPLWTFQRFNDKPIFHLPRGGMVITEIP